MFSFFTKMVTKIAKKIAEVDSALGYKTPEQEIQDTLSKMQNTTTSQGFQFLQPVTQEKISTTYPMHDLQAATALLFPDFYNVTRMSIEIGDVGQIIVNKSATETQKNIYVLDMPLEKQPLFYQSVLSEYNNFNCLARNNCQATNNSAQFTTGQIAALASSGVAALGLTAFAIYKRCKKNQENYKCINDTENNTNVEVSMHFSPRKSTDPLLP